ncbi:Bicaudal D-related protein homolog [Eumeta japonica]|uniref:Bicaudal D-related protein homolog n=1 Tax=Eumeta variegata TaxID=151549 RepID=A0A4C1Z074_EUMVA|nr:Bicaudal D-related protein homolog [Eumeta japonica]
MKQLVEGFVYLLWRTYYITLSRPFPLALAKTRGADLANSQLYEAVRQKIDLGQQLEQWQMDMQELINEQMKHKLTSQEKRRKLPDAAPPTRTRVSLIFSGDLLHRYLGAPSRRPTASHRNV